MKRIALMIGLIFLARCAFAQTYGRLDFSLQNAQGQAIAGATVNVYSQANCGGPAGALATLYPTATGGTPLTQPLITNGFGASKAYAAQGCYTVVYYSNYTGTLTFADQNAIAASSINADTALTCANQASLVGSVIYDCFLYQDGTVWSAQTAQSGNSQWQVTGDGAKVVSQHLIPKSGPPTGNYYAWLPNTSTLGGTPSPITTMGGTFRFCSNNDGNPYAPGQIAATMLASNVNNDLGHGFMHLELGPTTWVLADTLTNTGGFVTVGKGVQNIKPDCTTEYAVEMDIDVAAGTVKVILPGGQVVNITDSQITTINPVKGGWQARDVNDGSVDPGWGSVWMGGPSQAKKFAATAGHSADINALQGVNNTYQYVYPDGMGPTFTLSGAAGLYRISTGMPISTFLLDEDVCLTANIPATAEQTLCFKAISRNGSGTMQGWQISDEGGALIDYAVVSNDGAGNLALDLHKNTASTLVMSMRGTGVFTPVTTYTVGATPYANQFVINFLTNPPPPFQITIPAGPGWVTVASQDVGSANQQLTGRFIMTAAGTPGASVIEDLDLEVSGYSNGTGTCIIPRAEGVGFGGAPTSPVTRARCTTNGAGHLIHLDIYNATNQAVTLTAANGTQTGAWTLNPNPTLGAVALADGGPDVAFQLATTAQALSLQLNGGIAMTGNQGNGALVQHSTGSTSTGGMAVYDANGNTINASTPSVNHAACWKANGVIGYCSVVVDASGICGTCN